MAIESSLSISACVLSYAFVPPCVHSVCVCVCALIIKEDREVYVMVMQPPVLSLPINNQVFFDVATMSKVAFFLHQLRHVNVPAVLSP